MLEQRRNPEQIFFCHLWQLCKGASQYWMIIFLEIKQIIRQGLPFTLRVFLLKDLQLFYGEQSEPSNKYFCQAFVVAARILLAKIGTK